MADGGLGGFRPGGELIGACSAYSSQWVRHTTNIPLQFCHSRLKVGCFVCTRTAGWTLCMFAVKICSWNMSRSRHVVK